MNNRGLMKTIRIIFCMVLVLFVTGCSRDTTKELSCSKDMSYYFVGEANLQEGETSPYNRTVQTNFKFFYTEDENEIKKVDVEYVAKATGEDYTEPLKRLSLELLEECRKRGFLTCELYKDGEVYTIKGSSNVWEKVEKYMAEFGQAEGSSIAQNKAALTERYFLCQEK